MCTTKLQVVNFKRENTFSHNIIQNVCSNRSATLDKMDLGNYGILEVSIVQNPQILSTSELAEEYHKLSTCYIVQKQRIDQYMQEIHTLKQDKVLKDKFLNQELQEITENYDRELDVAKHKHLLECEELQNRLTEARLVNEKIELENQQLKSEYEGKINQLQVKAALGGPKTCSNDEMVVSIKRIEYLTKVESEYADLTEELNKKKLENSQLMSRIAKIEVNVSLCIIYYEYSNGHKKHNESNKLQLFQYNVLIIFNNTV